jgi:hypothetical protein
VSFGDGSISRFISSPDPEGLQNHATELRVEPRTVMLSMEKSILDLDEISVFCYPSLQIVFPPNIFRVDLPIV